MCRLALLALGLVPLQIAVVAQSEPEHPAPVLTISLYAPFQPDSPVHIVGLEHSDREIWFDLSNTSDKGVTDVILGNFDTAPVGCAKDEWRFSSTAQRFPVRIGPHGLGTATRENAHYPEFAVHSAIQLGAAHFHSQVWIEGIYFEDGSRWPVDMSDFPYPCSTFDSKLVEAEPGTCRNFRAVLDALGRVNKVIFEPEGPEAPAEESSGVTVPHLRYSCRFEGTRSICRLPFDPDHLAQPPSRIAPQKN